MSQCGGWGTTVDAPAGYHARSGIYTIADSSNAKQFYTPQLSDNMLNLGFVADPDQNGWDVGYPNKYNGDYFLPRAPWVGWGVSFDGHNYTTDRSGSSNTTCNSLSIYNPFPGEVQSVSADLHQAIWQGTDNGLQIRKIVTVQDSKVYFVVRVEMTNTSSQAINSIYYGEYVNPDNDCYYMDQANRSNQATQTNNTVIFQNPTDRQTLIQALGVFTHSYLGLGSKDCRAKTFFRTDNQEPPPGGAIDWFNGNELAFSGTTGYNNLPIGIVYNIGSLQAGASTSFTYTYILKQSDFDDALGATDPQLLIKDSTYNSGSNVYPCDSQLNISIVNNNNNYNNWVWSPATGLSTTQGDSVIATVQDTAVTYTITGTGGCGTKTLTVTINPLPPKNLSPRISIAASQNLMCSPGPVTFTATSSDGLLPTYQWKVNGIDAGIDSLTYTYTPKNGDSVYCIMTNNHPCFYMSPDTSNLIVMKINSSNTLYVDSSIAKSGNGASWSSAFKTLNEAIDWVKICPNITTINVAKGTYYPTGNQAGTNRDSSFIIFRGGIKIYGGFPSGGGTRNFINNPTILDGNIGSLSSVADNSYHIMVITQIDANADSIVIDGLIFQNGNAIGTGTFNYYGSDINQHGVGGLALYQISNNGKTAVRNITFLNNHADNAGGAVGIGNAISVLQNCTFQNNSSNNIGGAVFSNLNSSVSILQCSFTNNISSNNGGAVYQNGSKLRLINNSFNQNSSVNGDAVYSANKSAITIDTCTFSNNSGTNDTSSVVYCLQSSAFVNNSTFSSNNSTAIFQSGNSLSVQKSSFLNNASQKNGGAIRSFGDTSSFIGNIFYHNSDKLQAGAVFLSRNGNVGIDSLINNLFIQNNVSSLTDPANGAAIFHSGGEKSIIVNNTFYGNISTNTGSALYLSGQNNNRIVANNIFYKSSNADVSVAQNAGAVTQIANLHSTDNPRFLNKANFLNGGLTLTKNSPGVNKGINNYVPQNILTDYAGNPRVVSDIVDIGAYESPYYNIDSLVIHTKDYVPPQVTIGRNLQMVAEVYPLKRDQHVVWNIIPVTGNASIDTSGLITGQSIGSVWVKAVSVIDSDIMDSMMVQIVQVNSVVVKTLNNVLPQIYDISGTLQLIATVYPLNVNQQVTWSIIPTTGSATIDANGLVTAVSGGNVWAKATSVQDNTKSDSILINNCSTKFAVNIFPNPAQNYLNLGISVPCGMDIYTAPATNICYYVYPPVIQVFNSAGTLVLSQIIHKNNTNISVEKLAPGVYYIQLNAALFQTRAKFIKR
ncbi:MAG: Ig-like domain-containing protein [Arachidicoccus sp.]|nr:Ig-like domain-containing protein [Arachidicoccus sp.]